MPISTSGLAVKSVPLMMKWRVFFLKEDELTRAKRLFSVAFESSFCPLSVSYRNINPYLGGVGKVTFDHELAS